MKILYFDIVGGIAGDMTVAALLGLGVPMELLREGLARLGLEGVAIAIEPGMRHGIAGTRFLVTDTSGTPQGKPHRHHHADPHSQGHAHDSGGGHPHRPYRAIRELVAAAPLPEGAQRMAQAIFRRLAEAEGAVHGVDPEEVEFHEVGAWDSIADVVCTALAVDHLAPEAIYCSPVPLGAGTARTAHGVMPIPGPATLELLRGFPVEPGGPPFERTTPTGAAILAALARPAPALFRFVPERVGVGLGTQDRPEVANLLRAVLGREEPAAQGGLGGEMGLAGVQRETVECVEVNLDDANPEWIGFLMERLLDAGALDVALIPIHMKKNRPGTLLQAIYPPGLRARMETLLFAESTTLGVRYRSQERAVLTREAITVQTRWGEVAGKTARFGDALRFAPEFESCRAIALREGVPLREVYRAAEQAFAASRREEN